MAKLPVYTSQGGITTDAPGNVRNIEDYSTTQRGITKAANALSSLAEQWQDSKDQVETLDGKNKFAAGMANILEEATNYTDYNNFADLQAKESEFLSRMNEITPNIINGFSNNQNATSFQGQAELAVIQNREKLKEVFRNKYIDNAKSNLIISQETNMENYITTGNTMYKQTYAQDLEDMFKAGFIDEAYKTAMIQKTDQWENYHIIRQAESNPELVINNLKAGKYNVKPQDYNELLKDLTSIKTNKQLMRDYEEAARQNTGEDEATKYIYGNTDYADKLKYINEQEFLGDISSTFAQQARRNIRQFKPAQEVSMVNAQAVSDILQQAYDLNADETISGTDYLKGVNALRTNILQQQTDGVISTKEAVAALNQLNSATRKKMSEKSVQAMTGYKEASDYIQGSLPPELRGEAIRNAVLDASEKETEGMTSKDLKQLYYTSAVSAVNELRNKNRQKAQKAINGETRELQNFVYNKIPKLSSAIGVNIRVTETYAQRGYTSEHQKGIAFDVGMTKENPEQRKKIMQALINDPDIANVATSDKNLLNQFKGNPKLRDFTKTDEKLKTDHTTHLHVTVKQDDLVAKKSYLKNKGYSDEQIASYFTQKGWQ